MKIPVTGEFVSTKFNEGLAFSSVFTQFPPTGWRATFTFAGYQPIVLRYLITLHTQEYASSAEEIAVDSVALSRTLLTVTV